jgi:hypothetical protein
VSAYVEGSELLPVPIESVVIELYELLCMVVVLLARPLYHISHSDFRPVACR